MKQAANNRGIFSLFILSLLLNIILIILLVINIGLEKPVSSIQNGNLEFNQIIQSVTPGDDAIISQTDVSVILRGSSINVAGSIVITLRDISQYPIIEDPGWRFDRVANIEFYEYGTRLAPDIVFNPPSIICFKLSGAQLTENLENSDYFVRKFNTLDQTWETLNFVTHSVQDLICGETETFSLFALAQKLPEKTPDASQTPDPTPSPEGLYQP